MAVAVAAAKAAAVTEVSRHVGVVWVDDDDGGLLHRRRRVKRLFIFPSRTEDRHGGRGACPSLENV